MTLRAVLTELEALLHEEERSLVAIDLDHVVALSSRKNELVEQVVALVGSPSADLPAELTDLARSVHEKAQHNSFLLQHLRGCLTTVHEKVPAGPVYGPDGRCADEQGRGSVVRVRS
jgi:hypothetical protein